MDRSYPALRGLLLQMAREPALPDLLRGITRTLAREPGVALARLWMVEPGDLCERCPAADACPGSVPCLHLVASDGHPRTEGADWNRLDGRFARFPFGHRKIGEIGTGRALRIESIEADASWIADPEWAAREGILGFGGAPLRHRGEVLGVLGVFTRSRFDADAFEWLQIIADHAAAAVGNARAFREIERLRRELRLENESLREEVREAKSLGAVVGRSAALARVRERIALVAPTDATVLIQGESGTGKELVAREIHRTSDRAGRPLIAVNCAAVPRELYESEFFGHVRGAFTGATSPRAGRFEAADGGTLLLDEVGEIPLSLQGKLLRVLQEGRYERVGEERSRRVDVRVIAATNRDLRAEVAAGRFREDLYYRLDVFPIDVPPLRERPDDIAPLADHLLAQSARRLGRRSPQLSEASLDRLVRYAWPGNARELANVIERALIMWDGGPLEVDPGTVPTRRARTPRTSDDPEPEVLTEAQMRERERDNLERAMRRTRWKIQGPGGAAELLGIRPTTLRSRLAKLGIERPG